MLRSFLRRLLKGEYPFLEARRYAFPAEVARLDPDALETARKVRGEAPSAILLHGVMQRSGTVFASELLAQHPDVFAYARGTWEFPFLRLRGDVQELFDKYSQGYPVDREQVTGNDFHALMGAAMIAHLYGVAPQGQRLLLKMPSAEYLGYFYATFPHENLLVLMRDGRDVVSSALKTWPHLYFADICRWWQHSARLILQCNERYAGQPNYFYARYEDALRQPEQFVRGVCQQFGLDEARYPFEKIHDLPLIGSSTERSGRQVDWSPAEKPKDFNPLGRWTTWPAGQKKMFKKIAGQTLLDVGYCEDLNW